MKEFTSWQSYFNFAYKVHSQYRFIYDEEIKNFFETLLETSVTRTVHLPCGSKLWRAQLGCDLEPVYDDDGTLLYSEEIQFTKDRMKPLANKATDGRANPKGIPYLYLANERNTAVAEMRPWKGAKCSVGQFRVNKDLRLIDFSKDKSSKFFFNEPDAHQKELSVWSHINQAFSRPVSTSEQNSEYVPTQIITEVFKSNSFDGIAYKSNFGKGHNIALFDLETAELLKCYLYEIKKMEFVGDIVTNPTHYKGRVA